MNWLYRNLKFYGDGKKIIPQSMSTIVNEKQDRLRGIRFEMLRKSQTGSRN